MKSTSIALALAATFSAPLAARAAAVAYEGVLVSGLPSSGSVGGFAWFLDQGANVDFWRFTLASPSNVTLKVDRLSANLDPALSLYAGQTSADTSAFSSGAGWGGMSFIGSLDDEAPANLTPGPGRDPLGVFSLAAGTYTIAVGGADSTDAGTYAYRITMTAAVPEPAPAAMLLAGAAVLGWAVRRRRRAGS